jgi:hypothetical protein
MRAVTCDQRGIIRVTRQAIVSGDVNAFAQPGDQHEPAHR